MSERTPLLGCIADDFTGATDLGNVLVREGLRTVQVTGVPTVELRERSDAIVVALKSRTLPPATAVRQSLEALRWLQREGCSRFYFKYCSTFDSTDAGNIGPVTDALMSALRCDLTLACPAFPETGRTVFRGHLFVDDGLLSESGMQHHPLTPMRDANLVRVLQRQTPSRVGLLRYDAIARGGASASAALRGLRDEGCRILIADAISDADLEVLGELGLQLGLLTGGSGLGFGFAKALRAAGYYAPASDARAMPAVAAKSAILAGSCSRTTLAQIAHWRDERPAFFVDPVKLAERGNGGAAVVREAVAFAERCGEQPVLFYASAEPGDVRAAQAALGSAVAGELVEKALADIARGLRALGVRRFVVAGGETSGAVAQALGARVLRIGSQIDPGVPWTVTPGDDPIALALKSGNFGTVDFFSKALERFETPAHA